MFRVVLLTATIFVAVPIALGDAAAEPPRLGYIVVLHDDVEPRAVAAEHARSDGADVHMVYRHALRGYAATLSHGGLAAVLADPRVLFVAEDGPVQLEASQALPTGVNRIDGEVSSTKSGDRTGTVDVGVAVIDSGIDLDHPDLSVAGGTDCTGTGTFDDGNGHGTHVAGIIGAKDNRVGVVGVAPGARLWAVRVFNSAGSSLWSWVICGIDWVTANAAALGIKVANMSLTGSGAYDDNDCGRTFDDVIHLAICNSTAAGVTYVAAAGNATADLATYRPATYAEVLAVTAIADFNGKPGGGASGCRADVDDTAADFSSYSTLALDREHTIAAPGVCIYSTAMGGFYTTKSGTSMAAPHVAGAAALCIAAGQCTGTPQDIVAKLTADAAAYNTSTPTYGFAEDPLHPDTGRYFGFLIRAAAY